MIEHLERMLWHLEEPQADPAPINSLLIAEAARDDGIKVLLSGAGGDDIFSGYRRHRALRAERYWSWLPVHARRALASGSALAGSRLGVRSHATRRVVKALAHAGVAADERLVGYFQWSPEHTRRGVWSADVRAALGDADARAPLLASLDRIPTERDALNRMLYLEAKHFLPDHNLNYTDKTGMAVGVEVRVPLLDLELVDLATRIPARFKQRGAVGKAGVKRAMERGVPRGG